MGVVVGMMESGMVMSRDPKPRLRWTANLHDRFVDAVTKLGGPNRAGIAEAPTKCASVGIQGIAWAFGGMIFALVYCTAGISGGHINPAVTFGLFLARKLSLTSAGFYIVMQCLGAICGAGVVKGFQPSIYQANNGGRRVSICKSDSQVSAESNGLKGLDIVSFKEPFAGKYGLGQQAKQQNTLEQNKESNGGFYRDYHMHSSGATTNSSGVKSEPGEVPIAEALRCQIEVQKRLQEHLEVQKKLQMRIEAQGKYLQSILEKAQKSLTLDMNNTISLEATRDQLTNFNLALSNLMVNMDGESRNENISEKNIFFYSKEIKWVSMLGRGTGKEGHQKTLAYGNAERKQLQDKAIQNWLRELNDAAYEGAVEKRVEYSESRETSSFITQLELYGRDEDKEKIVKVLVQDVCDSEDVSMYPIIGIGGLGKTTLEQITFNDERVERLFEPKIWVYVSQDFDVKTMIKAVIRSASGEVSQDLDLGSLQRTLQDKLSGKRYLIVLDDVWNDDQEKRVNLKYLQASGSKGASIVVTTRLETISSIMGTILSHHLLFLSDEDCWMLFRQRAFGHGNAEHPNLVAIGKEIVKKRRGVPLAAGPRRFSQRVLQLKRKN
ncbi:unnamed protein product [Camellia sinensis]